MSSTTATSSVAAPVAAPITAPSAAPVPAAVSGTAGYVDAKPLLTEQQLSDRPMVSLSTQIDDYNLAMRCKAARQTKEYVLSLNVVLMYNEKLIKAEIASGSRVDDQWTPEALIRKPTSRDLINQMVAALPKLPLVSNIKEIDEQIRNEYRHKLKNGIDDREGHFIVAPGDFIIQDRFMMLASVGKGSFGTVVRAIDRKTNELVAVKVSRSGNYFINQAKLEVKILLAVNSNPRLSNLVVRLRKYILHEDHAVLVFPLLSINLYQLLKLSKLNGVSLDLTRKFVCQLMQVLQELDRANPPIIHCDLKPENILLYDQSRSGIRVIDFGSACFDDDSNEKHKYIQSRFYRSPEVIMGLPYGTAIDRWSVACIAIEMHTGQPLFPGRSEAEQLARMHALLGRPPAHMLEKCSKRDKFFDKNGNLLRPPASGSFPTSLHDVIGTYTGGPRGCRKGTPGHSEYDYKLFYDYISKLMTYDPAERMSCSDALRHPFVAVLQVPPAAPPAAAAAGGASTTAGSAAGGSASAAAPAPATAPAAQ